MIHRRPRHNFEGKWKARRPGLIIHTLHEQNYNRKLNGALKSVVLYANTLNQSEGIELNAPNCYIVLIHHNFIMLPFLI